MRRADAPAAAGKVPRLPCPLTADCPRSGGVGWGERSGAAAAGDALDRCPGGVGFLPAMLRRRRRGYRIRCSGLSLNLDGAYSDASDGLVRYHSKIRSRMGVNGLLKCPGQQLNPEDGSADVKCLEDRLKELDHIMQRTQARIAIDPSDMKLRRSISFQRSLKDECTMNLATLKKKLELGLFMIHESPNSSHRLHGQGFCVERAMHRRASNCSEEFVTWGSISAQSGLLAVNQTVLEKSQENNKCMSFSKNTQAIE
ncbi:hypothetical protein U9M48_033231 [Paspalum notatum var. saurae]|uniref:Uncharacterized protein n=1 Tax=Paspalum notatum var. saurae TaxID=547442 RepID=A0AAQ3U713_PASNO